jgi:hypothetical protein
VAAAVATELREAGRTVTLLDSAVACPPGPAADLAVRLLGEVVRNGGVVVCSGEAGAGPGPSAGGAGPGAATSALLLEVRERDANGPVESLTPPDGGAVQLFVPPGAAPEVVGELVREHLGALGYLPPAAPLSSSVTPEPPSLALATA